MASSKLIVSNPYDESKLGELAFATTEQISSILAQARESFASWRTSPAWERAQLLEHAAVELASRKEEFASLIRDEAGKPITYARVEVDRAIGVLKWAAAEAQRFGGELLRLDASSNGRSGFGLHTRFPRGVILGITPFNFPLNLAMHKIAPAIACGCSIVIKPSPATPLTTLKLAELFASGPRGLVQVVIADDKATEALTRADEIAMISFTGSARVGRLIRAQAPQKPCTLELGGNAWVIVMEDTPRELLPAIARRVAAGAFGYAGQSCISVQNVAVSGALWSDLKEQLASATASCPYGDPTRAEVLSGPVIHRSARERIEKQISLAPEGSEVIRSSNLLGQHAGQLLAPTLVAFDRAIDSSLTQEEIFGPVMTATSFQELPSLIARINSSRYGLQAGVYTQHWPTIERLYRELEVGGVIVNDVPTTRYDHLPYGGVKDSGEGREGVRYAMEEMTAARFLALSSELTLPK